jgi:hypothetical protein
MADVKASSPYQMTLSLAVLEQLGLKLYSNVPAVISEIIANSYDADASKVEIDINPDSKIIIITDDGVGMNITDINDRFLKVGYRKRDDANNNITAKKRKPMGRKGIGKLSIFAIAEEAEIYTVKGRENHAFSMDINEIKDCIKKEIPYFPKPINVAKFPINQGCKIILKKVNKDVSSTASFLRKRVARNFSILNNKDYPFDVIIDKSPVTLDDRAFYKDMEMVWLIDEQYKSHFKKFRDDKSLSLLSSVDGVIDSARNWKAWGWIGTIKKPSLLKDTGNSIIVLARGRLFEENILSSFNDARFYTKYLIGEINAEFLDDDGLDDIATSNRQHLIEEDPRFDALKLYTRTILNDIERKWSEQRSSLAKDRAISRNNVVADWYNGLDEEDKPIAHKLFSTIEKFPLDDQDEYKRHELYQYGLLAFEKLKLRGRLEKIDQVNSSIESWSHDVSGILKDIEAYLYHDIVFERVKILRKFQTVVDDNEKEKLIQEVIAENLWLLSPSWERAAMQPQIETQLKTFYKQEGEKLEDESALKRLDIFYRSVTGKHVIVELKRSSKKVTFEELVAQCRPYVAKMRELALKIERNEKPIIELAIILGEKPKEYGDLSFRKGQLESIGAEEARIYFYDELINNSLALYEDHLEKDKHSARLRKLADDIIDYAKSIDN